MNLSSRPTAPFALWLATGKTPSGTPGTWNGRAVPAFPGFSDADTQTLWAVVRDAFRWWKIDVVAGDTPPLKPNVGIGFAPAFGYPGGGQANVGAWQMGGVQAYVFVDVNQNNPLYCGLDAVHEAGHVLGGFSDITVNSAYAPGWWMGMPLGDPQWTQDQKAIFDARFGTESDLNFDGKTTYSDAPLLNNPTSAEAINLGRNI